MKAKVYEIPKDTKNQSGSKPAMGISILTKNKLATTNGKKTTPSPGDDKKRKPEEEKVCLI
jgi:hypothetical protein